MGDFKVVRRPCERSGCTFKPIKAVDFNTFLSDTELLDVKQGGRRFTRVSWDGLKMRKLDRLLINKAFAEDLEDTTTVVGDRVFSNHCPVMLKANVVDFGPSPFRSYDHWLTLQGFTALVKVLWDQNPICGSLDFVLKVKFKRLKEGITTWRNASLPGLTS